VIDGLLMVASLVWRTAMELIQESACLHDNRITRIDLGYGKQRSRVAFVSRAMVLAQMRWLQSQGAQTEQGSVRPVRNNGEIYVASFSPRPDGECPRHCS